MSPNDLFISSAEDIDSAANPTLAVELPQSSELKHRADVEAQQADATLADAKTVEGDTSAVSQPQGDNAEGLTKVRGRNIKDLVKDPSILQRIAWSEHAAPNMALRDRIGAAELDLAEVIEGVANWQSAGKPACDKCSGAHPPPCLERTELDIVRVAKVLFGNYQKRANKAEMVTKAKKAKNTTPAMPPVCLACFVPHWGLCKKPACSHCKINHWRGANGISCAAAMVVKQDAVIKTPRLLWGVAADDKNEELAKFARFYRSVPTSCANKAIKLFGKVMANKQGGSLDRESDDDDRELSKFALFHENINRDSADSAGKLFSMLVSKWRKEFPRLGRKTAARSKPRGFRIVNRSKPV